MNNNNEHSEDSASLSNSKVAKKSFSSWGDAFKSVSDIKEEDLGNFNFNPSKDESSKTISGLAKISEIAKKFKLTNESAVSNSNDTGAGDIPLAKQKKKKRKSKKKRKISDVNDGDEDAMKKKQKSKKSEELESDEVDEEAESVALLNDGDEDAMKKKQKSKKSEELESDEVDEESESVPLSSTPVLEGQIVEHNGESLMVLLDRSNQIVYSMTERSGDGLQNKIIGKITSAGKIIITVDSDSKDDTSEITVSKNDFPFPTDPDDHCESPFESYKHIEPILNQIAKLNKKSNKEKDELRIYDPYYCNGLVKQNLAQMGFTNVYNKCEDAYKTWDDSDTTQPYPENIDLFITNPPYSGDHIERLMEHVSTSHHMEGKPWCLLMPNYVHKKEYYKKTIDKYKKGGNCIQPFYLVPKKRYVYLPPKNFREKKDSDVHKKSSPFVSMWYIWGGTREKTESLIRAYTKQGNGNCDIARSVSALRDLRRKAGTKRKK